jgi:hypothetical protein
MGGIALKRIPIIILAVLLGISIIFNIVLFQDRQKYRDTTNDYIYNSLINVFGNVQKLNTQLNQILDLKQIKCDEAYEIKYTYSAVSAELFGIRDLSIRLTGKDSVGGNHFAQYLYLETEINNFAAGFRKLMNSKPLSLSQNDMDLLNRLKQLIACSIPCQIQNEVSFDF